MLLFLAQASFWRRKINAQLKVDLKQATSILLCEAFVRVDHSVQRQKFICRREDAKCTLAS